MRALFAECSMAWPADLPEARRQVNLECDDPVDDMGEDNYPDDELEDYVDTASISSWAPPLALPPPQATWPPLPTQPAALGMQPARMPAGVPAAAESGSAPQPWKCPPWGGQKRKCQESPEEGKRQKVGGGAASTTQQSSAQAPIRNWLAGGADSTVLQGSAPAPTPGLAAAANGMQESTALGTDAAGPAAAVPAALANPSADEGNFANSSFGSSQVQAAVRNNPAGIQSTYQFSSF